jgi:hypothetical protein
MLFMGQDTSSAGSDSPDDSSGRAFLSFGRGALGPETLSLMESLQHPIFSALVSTGLTCENGAENTRVWPCRPTVAKTKVYATALVLLGLLDHQAFAGRFYGLFAFLSEVIDLGYAFNLSQQLRFEPPTNSGLRPRISALNGTDQSGEADSWYY